MLNMGRILLRFNLDAPILNKYGIAVFGKMFINNISLQGNWTKNEETAKDKRQWACCMFQFPQTVENITIAIKQ
jgi:hypothetical protein